MRSPSFQLLSWVLLVATIAPSLRGTEEAPATQGPVTAVPITAEPHHLIRFDNGTFRIYETLLAKGQSTLWHEHREDSFQVFFGNTQSLGERKGEKAVIRTFTDGTVFFGSAAAPYTHRVEGLSEAPFHVMVVELPAAPIPPASDLPGKRSGPPFTCVLENARGRAYRFALKPGEATGRFARAPHTVIFALSTGRISEAFQGRPRRLWDFDPARFRWSDTTEPLAVKNEGTSEVAFVEFEFF